MTQKVYVVTWFNGEYYRQDQEEEIIGIFSTKESAKEYADNWKDKYKKECNEIAEANNYYRYDDYSFEFYFPERVWIKEHDLL